MTENLKQAITQMLFMSDEQILSDEVEKFVQKKDWYQKLHWTEKRQEEFCEWMSNFLKKNWQGITKYKLITKKFRDKATGEFILNYGCVTRLLKNDDFTQIIPFEQLKDVMSKREYKIFEKWMFCQTTSLYGVDRWDLERFLNYKSNLKK